MIAFAQDEPFDVDIKELRRLDDQLGVVFLRFPGFPLRDRTGAGADCSRQRRLIVRASLKGPPKSGRKSREVVFGLHESKLKLFVFSVLRFDS